MPIGLPEFADNPENRCPVVLLLDTSGSMAGEPIQELNKGIQAFQDEISKDTQATLSVEISIITFGETVTLQQDFITVDQFKPPTLVAAGLTPMGEAIELALDTIEKRKQIYKKNGINYYRPWIVLITDGAPTDEWENAANKIKQSEAQRRCIFFAVAVEGADLYQLKQIAVPERPPVKLYGLDFRELFVWLSHSTKTVSATGDTGEVVALPPVGWGEVTS
jgi:uncharacterized protein YegL